MVWMSPQDWGGGVLIRPPSEVPEYRYSHLLPSLPTAGLLRKRQRFTSGRSGRGVEGALVLCCGAAGLKAASLNGFSHNSEGPDGGSDLHKVTALAEIQRAPL